MGGGRLYGATHVCVVQIVVGVDREQDDAEQEQMGTWSKYKSSSEVGRWAGGGCRSMGPSGPF